MWSHVKCVKQLLPPSWECQIPSPLCLLCPSSPVSAFRAELPLERRANKLCVCIWSQNQPHGWRGGAHNFYARFTPSLSSQVDSRTFRVKKTTTLFMFLHTFKSREWGNLLLDFNCRRERKSFTTLKFTVFYYFYVYAYHFGCSLKLV